MKPSVSKLIGLLDKPSLLKWANKIGLEGINIDDYRKKSMSSGLSYHKQIENFLTKNIPFESEEIQQKCVNFFADKKIICVEKQIENEYFLGRLDIKIEYNGLTYICDFKSNQKNIYFENKLQLISYKMVEKSDKIAIISIPDFTFLPIEIIDYSPYEQILINLSNIYQLKESLWEK